LDALPFAVVRVALWAPYRVTRYSSFSSGVTTLEGRVSAEHVVMHSAVFAGEPYGFASPVEGLDREVSLDLYIGSYLYIPPNGCILDAAFNRMGFH
jgi:hypothetical protein